MFWRVLSLIAPLYTMRSNFEVNLIEARLHVYTCNPIMGPKFMHKEIIYNWWLTNMIYSSKIIFGQFVFFFGPNFNFSVCWQCLEMLGIVDTCWVNLCILTLPVKISECKHTQITRIDCNIYIPRGIFYYNNVVFLFFKTRCIQVNTTRFYHYPVIFF